MGHMLLTMYSNPSRMQSTKHLFLHSRAVHPAQSRPRSTSSIPVRHGGMGLINPSTHHFQTSKDDLSTITDHSVPRSNKNVDATQIAHAPSRKRSGKQTAREIQKAGTIHKQLSLQLKRQLPKNVHGSSSWLYPSYIYLYRTSGSTYTQGRIQRRNMPIRYGWVLYRIYIPN